MSNIDRPSLIVGGICGMVSAILYLFSHAFPPPQGFPGNDVYAHASIYFWMFPLSTILAFVASYSLFRLIAQEKESTPSRLAFLFAGIAFAVVTIAIVVYNTAGEVVAQKLASETAKDQKMWRAFLQGIETVNLGVDLMCNILFGLAMIIVAVPIWAHNRLGVLWAIPVALLGLLLICLNIITAPQNPTSRGFVDVGIGISIYGFLLSVNMLRFGIQKGEEINNHRITR